MSDNFAGNHKITIESMLSADFANHTQEHFKKCLDTVPQINKLLISKDKCDNEKHYQDTLLVADMLLSLSMIEKRLRG